MYYAALDFKSPSRLLFALILLGMATTVEDTTSSKEKTPSEPPTAPTPAEIKQRSDHIQSNESMNITIIGDSMLKGIEQN